MTFLSDLLEIPDENIHLKVLQTMLICITPKYLDFNEFETIDKVCFRILVSKNTSFLPLLLFSTILKILWYKLQHQRHSLGSQL